MKEKSDKKPLKWDDLPWDDNWKRAERNFDTPYEPSAEEIASEREVILGEPQFKGDDKRQPFVTIMKLGWWRPVLMEYDEEVEDYLPWQTGICSYPTKEKALRDAKAWAKAEGITFKE